MFVVCIQFVPEDCTEIAEVGDEVYVHYKVRLVIVCNNLLLHMTDK